MNENCQGVTENASHLHSSGNFQSSSTAQVVQRKVRLEGHWRCNDKGWLEFLVILAS